MASSPELPNIVAIYRGSDGEATKRLYERLARIGPAGEVALQLFRAQKASERAKLYRGGLRGRGSFRSMAYQRKQWAMDNLAQVLLTHGANLGIDWGWSVDEQQDYHSTVLYVDIPCGQVSFHTAHRGQGPEYLGKWDGIRGVGPERICRYATALLSGDLVHDSPPARYETVDMWNDSALSRNETGGT